MSRIKKSQALKFLLFRKDGKEKSTPKNQVNSVIEEMIKGKNDAQKDFMINYLAEDEIQSDGEAMMKALEFH